MEKRRAGWDGVCAEYSPLAAGSIDGTDEQPHDQGIIRAMNAKYKPNKAATGHSDSTVFVSRLNPRTNEETLQNVFSKFGEIKRLRLVRDIVTGFSKRYAFVEYYDRQSADDAYKDAYKIIVDDSEILVDFELERTLKGWVPRRLGGGFGGKKESGQLRFGGRDRPFRKPIIMDPRGNRQDKFPPKRRYREEEDSPGRYGDVYRSEGTRRDNRHRDSDRYSRDRRYGDHSQSEKRARGWTENR